MVRVKIENGKQIMFHEQWLGVLLWVVFVNDSQFWMVIKASLAEVYEHLIDFTRWQIDTSRVIPV